MEYQIADFVDFDRILLMRRQIQLYFNSMREKMPREK